MEEKLKYEFEGKIAPSAVAAYLEMLAAGLRKGRAQIDASGAGFNFSVAGDVDFEVEIKVDSEKREGKVEIEFSWDTASAPAAKAAPGLRISSGDGG